MKVSYKFAGRHGTGQYMWKAYRDGVFVGRYVAMVDRFWSGEPLPNSSFHFGYTDPGTDNQFWALGWSR